MQVMQIAMAVEAERAAPEVAVVTAVMAAPHHSHHVSHWFRPISDISLWSIYRFGGRRVNGFRYIFIVSKCAAVNPPH
jgi:hypothetical protein